MTWIQTHYGYAVDLINPTPDQFVIQDIAYALAHLNRYTGHVGRYSVAEHSVRVARALRAEGADNGTQKAGLMHDAHETYCGDVASPIKHVLGEPWKAWEERMARAVRFRFGVVREMPQAVMLADTRMLLTERRALMGDLEARPWGIEGTPYPSEYGPTKGFTWPEEFAREKFLEEAERLGVL